MLTNRPESPEMLKERKVRNKTLRGLTHLWEGTAPPQDGGEGPGLSSEGDSAPVSMVPPRYRSD